MFSVNPQQTISNIATTPAKTLNENCFWLLDMHNPVPNL